MKHLFIIAFVFGVAFIQSCSNDDADACTKEVPAEKLTDIDKTRLDADIAAIDAYLVANSIIAQSEPNGIRYVVTTLGTGSKIQCLETNITIKTTGWLLKFGTEFQPEAQFSYPLNKLILGWQLALPLFPAGSKVTLYIPSGYGYGVAGTPDGKVPSNANLIFDIELISIN